MVNRRMCFRHAVSLLLVIVMTAFAVLALGEGYPEAVAGIDFGGQDVYLYGFSAVNSDNRSDNPTEEQTALYAYRDWLNKTYNVRIHEKARGDWGAYTAQFIEEAKNAKAGEPLVMYTVEQGSLGAVLAEGAAAPLTYDFSGSKWSKSLLAMTTLRGRTYAIPRPNEASVRMLFFNKKVLTDAGVDPESIYDLQQKGEWTWEAFESILEKVQNTEKGIYGLLGMDEYLYEMAVFLNHGSFYDFNEDGDLVCTAAAPETIEGLEWAKKLIAKYDTPRPEDASWNWENDAWAEGNTAFYIGQAYQFFSDYGIAGDTEWGAVAFPVHTAGDPYLALRSSDVVFIPAAYDEKTAADLTLLYDLWTDTAPGTTSSFEALLRYTDERAVRESYAMLQNAEYQIVNHTLLLGKYNEVFAQYLWTLSSEDTASVMQRMQEMNQPLCDEFNAITK